MFRFSATNQSAQQAHVGRATKLCTLTDASGLLGLRCSAISVTTTGAIDERNPKREDPTSNTYYSLSTIPAKTSQKMSQSSHQSL